MTLEPLGITICRSKQGCGHASCKFSFYRPTAVHASHSNPGTGKCFTVPRASARAQRNQATVIHSSRTATSAWQHGAAQAALLLAAPPPFCKARLSQSPTDCRPPSRTFCPSTVTCTQTSSSKAACSAPAGFHTTRLVLRLPPSPPAHPPPHGALACLGCLTAPDLSSSLGTLQQPGTSSCSRAAASQGQGDPKGGGPSTSTHPAMPQCQPLPSPIAHLNGVRRRRRGCRRLGRSREGAQAQPAPPEAPAHRAPQHCAGVLNHAQARS